MGGARKKPLRMKGVERRRNGNPAAGKHGKEAARLSHASRRKAAPPTQTAPATPPPGGKETDMHLIACEVFRPELERLTRAMRNAPEVTYLEQGLHDTPDELRRRVQQAVDALEAKGETIIFLAYGLCGRGLTGVTGRTAALILPRVHDCIPVLLGATQEQANESSLGGGTYWLSPGWLRYSQTSFIQNREKRFKEYEERFGAFLYIVPAVNYYHNFLDHQWIYESWSPRMMQEGEMIEQSTNLLGAMFAVWNDRVGNGISQQDVHIRTFPAMQVMSEKLWKGENTRNIPFETFETWCRTTPEAPGVNLQASIDDRKDLTLSGQEIILQGNDSVLTSIPEIGYPYSVEFEIYADPKPNIDAVLFKGPHSVFTANWQNTGKFAFSRDGYEFIFHSYRLPVEKWTKVRVEGDAKGTSLYINGELQERLEGRIGVVYNQKSLRKDSIWYQETLIFPLKQIGDKLLGFKGRIRNVICTPLNEKRYSL